MAGLILALALLAPAAEAQRLGGQRPPRRDVLEQQVFTRFVNRVSADMRLDDARRTRLTQQLQRSGRERRELAQQTVLLRRRLVQAARDTTIAEGEVDRLLQQFAQLRVREQELWNRDQAELATILTPRQRAVFVLEWMRFNERIRDVVQQRLPDTIPERSR